MKGRAPFTASLYPDKSKIAIRIIIGLVLLTAVVLIVALASFWQQERATARELRDKLSELGVAPDTPSSSEPSGAVARLCESSTAQYTAEVGKFSVSLPESNYVIIKNHEGSGEGGPSSKLSVGTCVDAANKVVGFATNEEVTLTAVPSSSWSGTTFAQWVTGRLEAHGGSAHELERVTIDGVNARDFRVEGLLESRVTFFEQNGIWYELTAADASSDTTPAMTMRTALIEGFSFTE